MASTRSAEERRTLEAVVEHYAAELDTHVALLVARLKEEIVEYRAVPTEDIEGTTRAILGAALGAIMSGRVDPGEIAALDELARRRVQQGFPLEALTRSFQVIARFVLQDARAAAEAAGLDPRALFELQDAAWQLATDAAAAVAEVNRELAVDLARRDSARRSDFLRGVLHGGVDARRIAGEAALYGLDPTVRYHPFRARPADQREEDALSLAVRRTGSTVSHRAVIGVLEGDLVGLTPQRPVLQEGTLALGEACPLADARRAFLATGPALEAALAFGRTGIVELADLGPLPLALGADDLAEALERRHFEALDREGQSGRDVEATVRALLEHDQNADEVSRAMHVHRNTVRYRLGRFRELTGLDVRCTDDLVTAWWLLARRAARRAR
jgi:PucR C-terminal helix-turn-helix domain